MKTSVDVSANNISAFQKFIFSPSSQADILTGKFVHIIHPLHCHGKYFSRSLLFSGHSSQLRILRSLLSCHCQCLQVLSPILASLCSRFCCCSWFSKCAPFLRPQDLSIGNSSTMHPFYQPFSYLHFTNLGNDSFLHKDYIDLSEYLIYVNNCVLLDEFISS